VTEETAAPAGPAGLPGPAAMATDGPGPPGYPAQYEQELVLSDGRRVLIRPIRPSDAPELAEAIRTADPNTLRRRFMGGAPRVTPALLEHLTVLDYVRRFALVAFDPHTGRGVAVGRYEPAGPGNAEIAVVVTPAWRCAGLATVLILLLAQAAAERGIRTFSASYLADNRPIATMVRAVPQLGRPVITQGIAELSLALDQAEPVDGAPPAQDGG
jgi:RimJ/RimL family protein N-acetyltransferase